MIFLFAVRKYADVLTVQALINYTNNKAYCNPMNPNHGQLPLFRPPSLNVLNFSSERTRLSQGEIYSYLIILFRGSFIQLMIKSKQKRDLL